MFKKKEKSAVEKAHDERKTIIEEMRYPYWICFFFGGCALFGSIGGLISLSFVGVVFAVIGFSLIYIGIKFKRTFSRRMNVLNIVPNSGKVSISYIASAAGVSDNIIIEDLQTLIKKELLEGVYVNIATNEVIINSKSRTNNEQLDARRVKCVGCGAINSVTGKVGECVYCGSPL
ncbi:MAG: hypothetical protein FWD38_07205 [Oscillospiraceae bacterium]|nr:hypothetical protein [Oscillospiraceae bacterium]